MLRRGINAISAFPFSLNAFSQNILSKKKMYENDDNWI